MTIHFVIAKWQLELAQLQLAMGSSSEEAAANTLVLPVAEAIKSGVSHSQIKEFLLAAWKQYSKKAAQIGGVGFFYCWFDEMSATLRLSFSSEIKIEALPFECEVHPLKTISEVAQQAFGGEYLDGIPFEELQADEGEEWPEAEEECTFIQGVYAGPVHAWNE